MTTEKGRQQLLEVETTCGSLLNELQLIWDEIGETDEERDNMLLQLERECLEVYRRKVDQANHSRAHMHKAIAEIQAELAFLCSTLGDRSPMTKDENRYNASKGAHRNLKRAERARVTISKIPALVDSLITKTKAWEAERGKQFLYDGVHLLSTLEEYSILRLEREEERRRLRDQRRLHEQLVNEQETLFGTKPSPNNRTPSRKASLTKTNGTSTPVNRRLSLGGAMLQSGAQEMLTPRVNGVAPVRNGTPANTESKKNKVWQTATTIQCEVDNDKPAGIKHLANLQALRHDIDAPGGRQPLSPVSTPMMMRQPHMNSIEDGMNKLQVVCSPMKVASLKSPCKSLNQQGQVEEENTTPAKAFPVKSPVFDTPANYENQSPCNQSPRAQNNHHQQQKQQQHIEQSFEEQRLGFWYNPEAPCPWTGYR